MTYPTSDFASELEWIRSNPSRIQKGNATYFSAGESGDSERFGALLVN